jgi:flagellar basal-body rod protein FlgG
MQISVSGMLAQQARLDMIAQDISNVNTVGYRGSRIAFQEITVPGSGDGSGGGVRALDGGRSSAQGTLNPSENPLSVALQGTGFLQVQLADGTKGLTRNGDIQIDERRNLVLPSGERIDPPVTLPADIHPEEVKISAAGEITANGKKIGRLTVVDVPVPDGLAIAENGLFKPSPASGGAFPAAKTSVEQGYVESSNVEIADAMVAMIETQRSYGMVSRAIHEQDELMRVANEMTK